VRRQGLVPAGSFWSIYRAQYWPANLRIASARTGMVMNAPPNRLAFAESERSVNERMESFDAWIQTFYKFGEPAELAQGLRYFVDSEWFAGAAQISLFTFARAAVLYPGVLSDFESLLERGDLPNEDYIRTVVGIAKGEPASSLPLPLQAHPRFMRSTSALDWPVRSACDLDCLWAEFFLTGNKQAVTKIADLARAPDWLRDRLGEWLQLNVGGIIGRIRRKMLLWSLTRITGIQLDDSTNEILSEGDLDLFAYRHASRNVVNEKGSPVAAVVTVLPFEYSQDEWDRFAMKCTADWSLTSLGMTHAAVREVYSE
jgi:hypothetical protein